MGSYCSVENRAGKVRLMETAALQAVANRLRVHSIRSTNAAGSGFFDDPYHLLRAWQTPRMDFATYSEKDDKDNRKYPVHPTSCSSMAEIMAVLFFHTMRYKISDPKNPGNDRFVLSKGHAAPILYAAWAEAGLFPVDDLLKLRKIDSDLEGHPTPRLSFIDVATGSLGQGLSCAAGMAYVGKNIDKASYRVYCVVGDGESAEGSVWEALSFASFYKLDNLVAIFDVNRLGQSEPTPLQHDVDVYKARLEAFGYIIPTEELFLLISECVRCNTYVIDGHSVHELCKKLEDCKTVKDKPTAIVAKTYKGKRFTGIQDQENWHGKPLGEKGIEIIKMLQDELANGISVDVKLSPAEPEEDVPNIELSKIALSEPPKYNLGEKVATRLAYGTALTKLGNNNDRIIALDGDTKNSTYAIKFKDAHPQRFIECFIAEQNLIGVAVGCSTRSRTIPFVSTFATFFTRAFDQLRMAAISRANVKCCGSHCGVSIGEDGPSQMGLEDLALFRSLPESTIFYPSDAVSTERACELAANVQGICYIRTSRPETEIIYENEEEFEIGKAKIVKKSDSDQLLIIAAGVTLREALKAAEALKQENINVRVLDPFTIKPIDGEAILSNARQCEDKIVTVEDHYPEGGLGDAVSSVVSGERNIILKRIAVTDLPRSGPSDALLDMYGISAQCVVKTIKELTQM